MGSGGGDFIIKITKTSKIARILMYMVKKLSLMDDMNKFNLALSAPLLQYIVIGNMKVCICWQDKESMWM